MERNLLIIIHQSASSYEENVRHPANAGLSSCEQKSPYSQGLARHVSIACCHVFPRLLTSTWKQLTVA
jgi:hypothetical protein